MTGQDLDVSPQLSPRQSADFRLLLREEPFIPPQYRNLRPHARKEVAVLGCNVSSPHDRDTLGQGRQLQDRIAREVTGLLQSLYRWYHGLRPDAEKDHLRSYRVVSHLQSIGGDEFGDRLVVVYVLRTRESLAYRVYLLVD